MDLAALLSQSPGVLIGVAFALGLIAGSFLNVVAHRLPLMLERAWRRECAELLEDSPATQDAPFNLVVPRSRCPACGHAVRARENVPVLSYLLLRGRCSACGARISVRYPVVEATAGALAAIVAWRFGLSWETGAALLFTWALIGLTVIDLDHKLLPDDITLPLLWLGLITALFGLFTDLRAAVVGALAGYLALWAVFHLFRLLTGKEGLGHGDFKLFAALGAWLGWQTLPLVLLLASVVGAVVGLALIALRGHDRSIPIPFGPYLAAAGWIALLWGDAIVRAYLDWATSPL